MSTPSVSILYDIVRIYKVKLLNFDHKFRHINTDIIKIYLHSDLVIALAGKWCLGTNTFILPWGESTVTLEDMLVLGGFSVLGHCVLKPVKIKVC